MKKFLVTLMLVLVIGIPKLLADTTHIVDRGETLRSIAQQYGVSEQDIIKLNPEAAHYIYVGMELTIPSKSSNSNSYGSYSNSDNSQNSGLKSQTLTYSKGLEDYRNTVDAAPYVFEENRKKQTFELQYSATSFGDAKASGSYGFAYTFLPWKVYDKVYAGIYFSPLNFNFGLVPKDLAGDYIKLGPAISYYITPQIFVSFPIAVDCYIYDFSNNVRTSWALDFTPAIYVGKEMGLFAGPLLSVPFTKGAKTTCGFRVGLYF